MRRVLLIPAYRRLLVAYTLNELAWSVGSLALAYLVYRRTGSALGSAAFFLSSQFVPALLSPPVVARVDHLAARRVLPALYGLEALAYLALAGMVDRFSIAPVLALALVDGTLALTARPLARATTVAVTSGRGLLREGNAVTNGCFSVAFMAGPAIGGAVVAAGGARAALLVNAGLFVVIAATVSSRELSPAVSVGRPTRGRVKAAIRHARRSPPIRSLLGVKAAGVLCFTIPIPVEVVYAGHTLHAGAAGYGALLSTWGAGAVAGSGIYARWRDSPARHLIAFGAGCIGGGLTIMTLAPVLAVALAGSFLGGIGNGVESVATQTALQERSAGEWLAMIMSLGESLNQAMPGLGILLGGGLAVLAGARVALGVAAAGSLAVAAGAWLIVRPPAASPGADGRGVPAYPSRVGEAAAE